MRGSFFGDTLKNAPWQRGIAFRTEDPGFEYPQGVCILGICALQCLCHKLICIVIVSAWEKRND
jgi:hypothetical protein